MTGEHPTALDCVNQTDCIYDGTGGSPLDGHVGIEFSFFLKRHLILSVNPGDSGLYTAPQRLQRFIKFILFY